MKLRNIIYILLVGALLGACARPKAPEFNGVENLEVQLTGFTKATISGDAAFYNPNKANVYIKSANMKVFMEDQEISHFNKDIDILAGGNTDFTVPVSFDVSLKDIDLGSFASAIGIGKKKEREFSFRGKIKVKMHGINFNVPVDHTERVEL